MNARKPLTLPRLRAMAAAGEKLVMLTCYDATFARVLDAAGVDLLLVGDSLGNVLQGRETTLPVTLDEMAYHTRCVATARTSAFLIADMPFGSYHDSLEQGIASAVALMRAGAQMVKVEGGAWVVPLVRALVERGIPVCGHLGLTPQSVHALGGWRVQGRDEDGAARLRADALALAEAGVAMIVIELVPTALSRQLAADVPVPLIGIGAGPDTAGQVLVLHDLLGLNPHPARFVRDFMADAAAAGGGIAEAVRRYGQAVRDGSFPDPEVHGY
ncbi:3-methyl-2-oxobutanoate hydroxymethyltransferase [Pseudaquabacterium rugosum]|jgi:3-methyl-2-oxobutanoate hydroxymethyltransferase|uniref:3-methyl-2-oxobutanoate hydroxymethyltransferase n=1 Tax=Pseudaquabacterium rugosum TaxID=2984194 RepID=A0ABU9BD29_9BURK